MFAPSNNAMQTMAITLMACRWDVMIPLNIITTPKTADKTIAFIYPYAFLFIE
jgi:hypothetical protein